MKKKRIPCPCGRPAIFDACCQPLLDGRTHAPDAETLMRSRYSAYATGAVDYLRNTWHASTRPSDLSLDDNPRWIGLKVLRAEATGADSAIVEFIARYRVGGRAQQLHEISRFVREDGRWYYVDGDIQPE
jgi:SEC-C motif-containing protein